MIVNLQDLMDILVQEAGKAIESITDELTVSALIAIAERLEIIADALTAQGDVMERQELMDRETSGL